MGADNQPVYLACYILSFVIAFVTLCLIIIYIKTKELHSYPCYFNILLGLVISIDNILRLIPFNNSENNNSDGKEKNYSIGCKIQGFSLALFDKFLLTTMTIYSTISFLGVVKFEIYKEYEKCIFITLTIISFLISLILACLFILNGVTSYSDICYVEYKGNDIKVNKILIDGIVTSALFLINLYLIIHLLIYICIKISESKKSDNKREVKKYTHHFWKYFADLVLNIITFLMVIFIIFDIFFSDVITSLSFVTLSLLVVLFYTLNFRILKEAKNIICCIKEENIPNGDDNEDDNDNDNEDNNIEIGNLTDS